MSSLVCQTHHDRRKADGHHHVDVLTAVVDVDMRVRTWIDGHTDRGSGGSIDSLTGPEENRERDVVRDIHQRARGGTRW